MYTKLPNLVIGFHGCDETVIRKVIEQRLPMDNSNNTYDWLGHGLYFWESNLTRAWKWAQDGRTRRNVKTKIAKTPSVIGAVIDLGYCLNLTDSESIDLLKNQYSIFKQQQELADIPMPENKDASGKQDLLLRYLDCAVIENLHLAMKAQEQGKSFDSVRGVFVEGAPIYPNAGFHEKTHIQICVRNPNCIKGFFLPQPQDPKWSLP